MELNSAIQEALLAVLCYDSNPKGSRLVDALVPISAYDRYFAEVADAAHRFLTKFKKPPGEHTFDLIEGLKEKNPKAADNYDRVFRSLEQTRKGINREYVVSHATRFARHQNLRGAIQKSVEILQSGKDGCEDLAEAELHKTLKGQQRLFDPGVLLNDPRQALGFLDAPEGEAMPTGVKELDRFDLGPISKNLHLFQALPNRGKSWWLINLGKIASRMRMKVLHISLEMSEDLVSKRYIQALFSVSKREERKISRCGFSKDKRGRFRGFREKEVLDRPGLDRANIGSYLTGRLSLLEHRPPIYIKQFPTRSLTVDGLRGFLDCLEGAEGFIPDILLLDYADLMKVDQTDYRTKLGLLYQDLRGLAVERNIKLATATQANQKGLRMKLLDEGNMAEDWSKNFTADTIISYNQTDPEKERGLARLHVVKARDEKTKFSVLISQCYPLGQFCLESAYMNDRSYWGMIESEDSDDQD